MSWKGFDTEWLREREKSDLRHGKGSPLSSHLKREIVDSRQSQGAIRANEEPPTKVFTLAKGDSDPFTRMNKTERRFYDHFILPGERDGSIVKWWFEGVKYRLGYKNFYTPDFVIIYSNRTQRICEIKGGHIYDDAAVKFKAAAEAYSILGWWEMWQWKKGQWTRLHPGKNSDAFIEPLRRVA